MIKDLELLIKLQTIDLRIHELIRSQSDLPKTLSDLERDVAAAQKAVDSVNQQLAANAAEKKSFEEKVAAAKTALDKSQLRLNSIKTNKEYDAVHTEIETFKNVIASADSRMKQLSEETEKLQQSLETHTADSEKIKNETKPKINEFKAKIASIDSSIAGVKQERSAITSVMPKPLLRTYDHILSRRKNARVLSLINNDTRTCSSCFKVLETQLINEIRRGTKLLTCQNCGAIFIWSIPEEDTKEPEPAAPSA